jgi:hypothetical protein
MRIVVDLPAPLLPTKPNTSPGRTAKATPSSAWTVPNRFDMPPMSSMRPTWMATSVTAPSPGRDTSW